MERARAMSMSSASAEYIEGLEHDLAAAQEQLAQMGEILSLPSIQWAQSKSGDRYCSVCHFEIDAHSPTCRLAALLSAAPAGGQVVWRGEAHHREFCTLHLPREADDALGQPEFDKVVDVTVRAVTEQGGE